MSNYCNLASVFDGERMHVVKLGTNQCANEGDLVRLSTGELCDVVAKNFVEVGGTEYSFIATLKPIEDDWVEIYRREAKEQDDAIA